MLNGEAVEYMARGTYSSMILLVKARVAPPAKPENNLETRIIQKFITWVSNAAKMKMKPMTISVLRRPLFIIGPAERAPTHAPTLKMPVSV